MDAYGIFLIALFSGVAGAIVGSQAGYGMKDRGDAAFKAALWVGYGAIGLMLLPLWLPVWAWEKHKKHGWAIIDWFELY